MKIYAIHNNTASRYYRLIPELNYLKKQGHEVILAAHDDKEMGRRIDWCDVVIFQMSFSEEWTKYAKSQGKKVVFECDDLLHIVPKDHYSYKETKGVKNRINWWWRFYQVFGKCDGFISTNKALDKKYGWLAKKSLVFPNYSDLNHWLKEYKENTSDKIRLLWAGSISHNTDLNDFRDIVKTILIKYPQVVFIYIGMGGIKSDNQMAKFIYGDDFWAGLPDNRESLLAVPGYVWPYKLASLGADLAVAPLQKNYFNGFKSQCKYLEYGINKIPAVYSKWFYKDAVGRKADSKEEWIKEISYLIENKEERKRLGEAAYQDIIKNHNVENHLAEYEKFLLSL